ncbi:hypothetical protein Q8A67_023348 [Cirrhinus molitorella]|uniref:Uncharacterized protein n=1 Tax=Cirrhinus molitorella TaxID=172907 RepID=A0AA88NZS7_9TELE|nr:hypothetical protein Q8A67_023348 [Cirrhinus molitorella]
MERKTEGGEDKLEGAYGGPVKGSIVLGRGAELIRRPNSNQRASEADGNQRGKAERKGGEEQASHSPSATKPFGRGPHKRRKERKAKLVMTSSRQNLTEG